MGFLIATALLAQAPRAVVVQPVANMHSEPRADSDVVSQAIHGHNVGVLESKNGWAHVRTADDYIGWMAQGAFRSLAPEERDYASSGKAAQVESLFANLYAEPDVTRRAPLLTVPFESWLEVISEPEEEDRRWIEVRLPDGRAAWIHRGDVAVDPRPLDAAEVVALARRFVGLPYLWGGTSTFGYDCSGFTQMLCRRRGVSIPRDSGPQSRWEGAVPVDRSSLKPSDLLFFGEVEDRVTHTGMYLGGGEFIHATTHKTPVVQVSRLDEKHWAARLLSARRLR